MARLTDERFYRSRVWTVKDDEAKGRKPILPVVIYAPKYDEELREEFDVEFKNGKYYVFITRIARNKVSKKLIGIFLTYREARDAMFSRFFEDFDRPSEKAVRSGASPFTSVWKKTQAGKEVAESVSIVEGTKDFKVIDFIKGKQVAVKEIEAPPTIITVRSYHPKFFSKMRERHLKRIKKLQRKRRLSFRK